MSNFQEIYAKLSDKELYKVLQNETDYNPEAIIVAQKEFQKRGLSLSDFEEFDEVLDVKPDFYESKLDFSPFWEIILPVKDESKIGIIYIKRIVLFIVLTTFYSTLINISYFYYLALNTSLISFIEVVVILSIIITFVMAYFFYKKKKIAWYYFGVSFASIIIMETPDFFSFSTYLRSIGGGTNDYIRFFFSKLVPFTILGILIWALLKKEVMSEFKTNKTDIQLVAKIVFILLLVFGIIIAFSVYNN